MSRNYSNTYAARVFSEHPIALWSLDDSIYFRSLLNSTYQQPGSWLIVDDKAQWDFTSIDPLNLPVISSPRALLQKDLAASVTYVQIESASISYSELDPSKDTIAIGAYVYEYGDLVEGYEVGFRYSDGTIDTYETNSIGSGWQQLIYTSEIVNSASSVIPFIKVNYTPGGGGSIEDYQIMINSISVGQWSEPYISKYNGTIPQDINEPNLQSVLPLTSYKMVPIDAYGFNDEDTGMVIVDNNKLLSYQTNMPMVFGSDNLTQILSPVTEGMPSLVVPGKGFLNQNGKYFNLTAEFWLRINPKRFIQKRIFGPVNSNDGLYMDNEFLTLRVGGYQKSYFIGKWYRPMLVDIRYSTSLVSLLINGDVVIEIDIDINNIDFPNKIHDWLGFYGDDNIGTFEIDCIAIYTYIVPDQVAKRRFIYGQGVQNAEIIANNFDGESLYIDFPFAQYAATLNYPDMTPWNAGYFNNIEANNRYLSFKNFAVPEFRFSGDLQEIESPINPRYWSEQQQRTWLELLSYEWEGISEVVLQEASDILTDNFFIQSSSATPFFKMRPNSAYNNVNGSIEFDSINLISDKLSSIYGLFQSQNSYDLTEQTLMYFYNSINNNTFSVKVGHGEILYYFNDILLEQFSVNTGTDFAAGIDIDLVTTQYPGIVGNFFANPQNISLSLMGHGDSTFLGKLYSLTFNNRFFHNKDIADFFNSEGFALSSFSASMFDYIGNYTFKPILNESFMVLDVCAAGYWEDSVPLSYFGKQVTSKSGLSYYDLDMIQFNIDYPSDVLTSPSSSVSFYDNVNVNSYITLQDFEQVGKTEYSIYTNTVPINSSRVLDFDNTTDVIETKFEVTDGTIIFPPKELVDFSEYYITIHLEIKVEGVNSKPIQIKRMILSSTANSEKELANINTRTGSKIYPISRYDRTYAYKDKNPYVIYQDSTPYLYLTGDSGISLMPYQSQATRAFSIPINNNKNSTYLLGGIQFWCMYNQDEVISSPQKIGRVSTPDVIYDIFLEPIDNGKRGKIQMYDAETGLVSDFINEVNDDIVYYQNGIRTKNPIVTPMMWTSILIVFGRLVSLTSVSGQVELNEGFIYNNIAIYQKSSTILGITSGSRTWQEIRINEIDDNGEILYLENQWDDWIAYLWNTLYSPQTAVTLSLNGSNILNSFLGTSTIISEDSSTLMINSDGVDLISDVNWNTTFVKPI